ncbi:MAG: 16S rRNA (uracil(1498)-N(3))-methyltransferase [Candidatus Spyradenecus sp.]
MNLILISRAECTEGGRCTLSDARAEHLRTFLHAAPGSTFRVGFIDGPVGTGRVEAVEGPSVRFTVDCQTPPLPPWYDLILALPRPRSLRRILFQSATLGVRNLFLVGASKVEKSYFSMHLLRPEEYTPILLEGLMQGGTTALPKLHILPRLRDLWSALPEATGLRLLANPAPDGAPFALPPGGSGVPLIAVGPDGGWTEAENAAFAEHGFQPFTLGPRPLRTDTAAIALPCVVRDRLACQGLLPGTQCL